LRARRSIALRACDVLRHPATRSSRSAHIAVT
jgi:hypothetical protein